MGLLFFPKSKDKYEFWELISAVWVKGNIHHLSNVRLVSSRVKYDMIDYIRLQEGRKLSYYGKESGRYKFNHSKQLLESVFPDGDKKECYLKNMFVEDNTNKIEAKDICDFIFSDGFLKEYEKDILRLYFMEGLTMKEMSKHLGYCESNISLILRRILPKLRSILVRRGLNED